MRLAAPGRDQLDVEQSRSAATPARTRMAPSRRSRPKRPVPTRKLRPARENGYEFHAHAYARANDPRASDHGGDRAHDAGDRDDDGRADDHGRGHDHDD